MSSRAHGKKSSARPPARRTTPWLWVLIGGGLLLVAAALALALGGGGGGSASGTPKLAVDKDEVNLGDVKLGQTVTVDFTLTNTGDGPLTFSKAPYIEVKEGC